MRHKIAAYGLAEQQLILLEAALPETHELVAAECGTDLIVTGATCTIIEPSSLDKNALNTLLAYYMDVGDRLDETVVWLGNIEVPDLPSFVRCDSFLDMLTELDSILDRAKVRYNTMQMYGGEYAFLSKRAIEESIEADIQTALHRKYGTNPDPLIVKRMRQELTALREVDATAELAAVYELTQWLRRSAQPFWVSGDAVSGLIPYLLEITDVNPLPPHLHCPKCHQIIWKATYKDGFDIPPEICPGCGETMQPDGHNLVWQEFASYGRMPVYVVHTPYDQQDAILRWVQHHWLQKLKGCDWSKVTPLDDAYLQNCNIAIVPDIDVHHLENAPAAADRDALLRIAEADWVKQAETGLPVPKSIAEAVAQEGLLTGDGLDLRRAGHLLRGGVDLTELITSQEDVFFYLKSHGFVDKDAFRGMCSVRKGRGFPVITDEMRTARDSWVLKFCESAPWLACRARILARLFFHFRAGDVPQPHSGLPTGFAAVDACLRGMQAGEVILVGGRPGMGKSSFVKGIALHLLKQGKTIAYCDLDGNNCWEPVERLHIYKQECGVSDIRQWLEEKRADILIIDSFQTLMESGLRSVKRLAQDLQIPVIITTNLSRDVESRPDPCPVASDVPYGEEILPIADTVLLLYRRAYYDPIVNRSNARCIIDKAKRCHYKILSLRWDDEKCIFTD